MCGTEEYSSHDRKDSLHLFLFCEAEKYQRERSLKLYHVVPKTSFLKLFPDVLPQFHLMRMLHLLYFPQYVAMELVMIVSHPCLVPSKVTSTSPDVQNQVTGAMKEIATQIHKHFDGLRLDTRTK